MEAQGPFSINSDNEFFGEVLLKQNMQTSDVGKVQWIGKEDICGVLRSTWLWAGRWNHMGLGFSIGKILGGTRLSLTPPPSS